MKRIQKTGLLLVLFLLIGGILGCATKDSPSSGISFSDSNDTRALSQVSSFGSNPGNLKMYKYVPSGVSANAPLVVVLHGCSQTASEYANDTEWNVLADKWKFYVLYAEQQSSNNQTSCFNWFEPGDMNRGQGEALSIKQMVDKMKADYSINAEKVFVTGLSAGGAMTTVMLAAYPDVFAGGGVMAGIPYKCATTMNDGFSCMGMWGGSGVNKTPQQWGDLARSGYSGYSGPYPVVSIWHGSDDGTVVPLNMNEIMEQWTNVHGTDQSAEVSETLTRTNGQGLAMNHDHKVYHDAGGKPVVETYFIDSMGHAITVDPGSGEDEGGGTGSYSVDKEIWSSYYTAKFWGLDNSDKEAPVVNISAPSNGTSVSGTVLVAADAADNKGVTKVEFYINGTLKSTDTSAPYEYSWNASSEYNGEYRIMAKAYDAAGNIGQDNDTAVTVTGGATDTTPAAVNITNPSNGDTVWGTVEITASAADTETGIAKVEFYIDGALKSTDTSAPYAYNWDTTVYANGTAHSIKAVAYDGAGNAASDDDTSVTVDQEAAGFNETFSSGGPDNSGWSGGWTMSAIDHSGNAGKSAYGNATMTSSGTASKTYSIALDLGENPVLSYWRQLSFSTPNTSCYAKFKVLVNGNVVDSKEITYGTYTETSWTERVGIDLSSYAYQSVTLEFKTEVSSNIAMEAYARAWVDDISISAGGSGGGGNDTTAPSVNITAPANGNTVSGTVTIVADASDDTGVSKVEFYIDGSKIGEDTSAPYEYSWDTTASTDASHSLKAVAYDAAGNNAADDDTSVTVSNGSGSCQQWTASNGTHVNEGRAYSSWGYYYAKGSNDYLGYGSWSTSTVKETSDGYYEKGSCQ